MGCDDVFYVLELLCMLELKLLNTFLMKYFKFLNFKIISLIIFVLLGKNEIYQCMRWLLINDCFVSTISCEHQEFWAHENALTYSCFRLRILDVYQILFGRLNRFRGKNCGNIKYKFMRKWILILLVILSNRKKLVSDFFRETPSIKV